MRFRVQRAGMTYLLTNVAFSFLALNMLSASQGIWALLHRVFLQSLGGIVFPVVYTAVIALTTAFFVRREKFTFRELYSASLFILMLFMGFYIISFLVLGNRAPAVVITAVAHFVGLAAINKQLVLVAPLIAFPLGVMAGYYGAGGTKNEKNKDTRKGNKGKKKKGKGE